MEPSAINHIALNCRNLAAQEAFFSKHFGFRRSRTFRAGKSDEYVILKLGSVEPLVFAFMVMRSRPPARRSHIKKGRELPTGLFAVEEHDYCVAKRTQRAAFIGSYQERTAER